VLFVDPDWFFWASENGVLDRQQHGELCDEAQELYRKATSIRIPQKGGEERREAEYGIDRATGKFASLEIVPASRPLHPGCSRAHVIDLSAARHIADYDKLGGRRLVEDMKVCVFGTSDYRMSKKRCEAFFEDEENFVPS